ncbi:hypothetical protein FGKAn22_19830 [Ferrigenium kumadai]|uniref:SPOR domain-containing protein n=1 Tax=Ferrigenium kumadai TaxID=1682490 RepID=A0AAN1T1J6_9PROT|nr:SPOR domain-containing protein [Ferrigenium kumadai]BBJ00291.1 hypothetical protein FGKAn22_19830 [Ferrigenium kumadai]
MRTLFWILLLGNVIFFAVMQWGGLMAGDEQAAQPQPPLNAEKIRLADMPQSAPVAALPASVPASAPVAVPAPVEVTPALRASTKLDMLACMEWGEFSGADLKRATAALGALRLGDRLNQRQVEQSIGYWVYIPPLKDKAAVAQKIAQLKARGIEEYFVVPDAGPWLHAISLGVFKTQEAAQSFLEGLRAKDVRSAQIGERASKLKMTVFVLNGLDGTAEAKLTAMQKDFSGSELKKVPCALTR